MKAAEIRQRFLEYFHERGHAIRPSSSLVPEDDPTLLFTNAGMVQFKSVFLGQEQVPYRRAVTAQKCVRAGGKHNDLEEVGRTARHHTFFEMLGNFSFGDYFKRDAVAFGWEFLVQDLGLDPDRLFFTVHHTDDEAAKLWKSVAGAPASRIYRLGDKDNFWQMAETGPCGPCSEIHFDLRPEGPRRADLSLEQFVEAGERGEFIELWNLVFMQFDRDEEGTLHPLPAPSIDTGLGLERTAAVLQGVDSNYHTDLFLPLLDQVSEVVGRPYDATGPEGVSYRVLADHARSVAFLLADGVYPSNEGRGYVLRRILRRAVRHAWLLGRRSPTLAAVVESVIENMEGAYPELAARRDHVTGTTRAEEERFLTTVEGGLSRFDEMTARYPGTVGEPVISGADAFRLYDTYGFPLDLTELMAQERGFSVDVEGFERELDRQRARSRADRAAALGPGGDELTQGWLDLDPRADQEFVGYTATEVETRVLALRRSEGRLGLQLEANPFYAEGGGQVSDQGAVVGDGWSVAVDQVRRIGDRVAVFGDLRGEPRVNGEGEALQAHARVRSEERHDTERNHTATHLLHAALRTVLGTHVEQRGSLVAPERLRFDFAHPAPLSAEERRRVEALVNEGVWRDHTVHYTTMPFDEAVALGAMALFGEKYGETVRVVQIPGVSAELCGGTHVRHTGEIGLFKIVSEGSVAAGVRRIEALTGPEAFRRFEGIEERLEEAASRLRTPAENVPRRIDQLLDRQSEVERLLAEVRRGSGAGEEVVGEASLDLGNGRTARFRAVRMRARDANDVRSYGDGFLEAAESGVTLVAAELPEGKHTLFAFVTDDLIARGVRADEIVRAVAALVGGRGGGRPHMAQAGVGDAEGLDQALRSSEGVVRELLAGGPDR